MKNKEFDGYKFTIFFYKTISDGIFCKLVDVTFLKKLLWFYCIDLKKGFTDTYQLYINIWRDDARIYSS